MGTGTGAGVYSLDLNIKMSLPLGKHSSIFQCECVAITHAATAVLSKGIKDCNIRILSDSMAILKALGSNTTNSSLIYECHQALERLASLNGVIFQWIKGHSESHGNDAADELARQGSNAKVAGPTILLPLPFGQLRSWVRQRTRAAHNALWANQTGCR